MIQFTIWTGKNASLSFETLFLPFIHLVIIVILGIHTFEGYIMTGTWETKHRCTRLSFKHTQRFKFILMLEVYYSEQILFI